MTKAETKRFQQLSEMGCIVCLMEFGVQSPAEIHHLRTGMGTAQRNNNLNTIPLCPIHHRLGDGSMSCGGQLGYHKAPERFEKQYGTETELLEITNRIIKKLNI